LSGFDRLRLRGTLRHLFRPSVMEACLNACRVSIKDFGTFAQGLTARIKAAAYASAEQSGRPFCYLSRSQISKEALARQIARQDGVTSGLIAIFSALENCLSCSVRGDRQTKHIHLVLEPRKCPHLYHYFQHEELGLCRGRVQTWFPFTVDLWLNGRDRLARQMDPAGLAYRQRVKHSVNGNSVKMYDKEGSVLRVETTINRTEEFKVFISTAAKRRQMGCVLRGLWAAAR